MSLCVKPTQVAQARAFGTSIIALLTCLALTLCTLPSPALAATAITQKRALSLTKTYDPNGYYILKQAQANGESFASYLDSGTLGSIDTAVHEMTHQYSFATKKWNAERIYLGGKKSVEVSYTTVFNSTKMASSVPKKLRDSRYDLYIANSPNTPNLGSCVDGIYGILDEFSAYCWGFNSSVKLYRYCLKVDSTELWHEYAQKSNVALAYVEFRYFTLQYLKYAKNHRPSVYKKILANKKFLRALRKTDRKFATLVKTYDKRLKNAVKLLCAEGYDAFVQDGFFWIDDTGSGLFISEYNAFAKQMNKAAYVKLSKKLGLSTTTVSLR